MNRIKAAPGLVGVRQGERRGSAAVGRPRPLPGMLRRGLPQQGPRMAGGWPSPSSAGAEVVAAQLGKKADLCRQVTLLVLYPSVTKAQACSKPAALVSAWADTTSVI